MSGGVSRVEVRDSHNVRGSDPMFDRDETCDGCGRDASVCTCPDIAVSTFRKADEVRRTVHLSEVKRFGHLHTYGNARTPVVAELLSGEIVFAQLKDQTDEVRREIRRRLREEIHPNYRALSRDVPDLFSWEKARS